MGIISKGGEQKEKSEGKLPVEASLGRELWSRIFQTPLDDTLLLIFFLCISGPLYEKYDDFMIMKLWRSYDNDNLRKIF